MKEEAGLRMKTPRQCKDDAKDNVYNFSDYVVQLLLCTVENLLTFMRQHYERLIKAHLVSFFHTWMFRVNITIFPFLCHASDHHVFIVDKFYESHVFDFLKFGGKKKLLSVRLKLFL